MLGKGLESLIPQKGGGDGGNAGGGNAGMAGGAGAGGAANGYGGAPDTGAHEVHAASGQPAFPSSSAPGMPASPLLAADDRSVFGELQRERVAESVFHIEVEKITPNPNQPRHTFDEAALRDLADSIREFGFLQPLVVSRVEMETPNGVTVEYQLIAGERRLLAAKLLGLPSVPAIVRKVDLAREKLELAVIENIQRENLNPIETARAFQRLQEEFRMTQREIAAKLGKSRETVANAVRLLDLPEYIRTEVEKGTLSESHARLLLAITEPATQERLFRDIVERHLTMREARDVLMRETTAGAGGGAGAIGQDGEAGARGASGAFRGGDARTAFASNIPRRGRPPKNVEAALPPELAALKESLSMELGAPVDIYQGTVKGSITITFYSKEELENIMRRLGGE